MRKFIIHNNEGKIIDTVEASRIKPDPCSTTRTFLITDKDDKEHIVAVIPPDWFIVLMK